MQSIEAMTPNRSVVHSAKACPQCTANLDPTKVPVHVNCDCSVTTDSIEVPHQDPEIAQRIAVKMSENLGDFWPLTDSLVAISGLRYSDILAYRELFQSFLLDPSYQLIMAVETDGIVRNVNVGELLMIVQKL